uniref:Uncharacterized protein n=1 Tax=Panagrolaimus sp. JU765 TaxID=591449 RepID=A0AC34Q7M0_9BILA
MLRKFWIFGVIDPDEVPNVTSIQETLEVKLLSPELGPSTTMLSFDPNLNLEWNSVLDPQVFKNFSSFGVIRNYEKIDFVISPIGLDGVVMKIITGHESKDSKLTSFGRKYFNKYQTEDVEKYIHEILLKLGHSDGSLDLQFVNFTETYQIINATQKFNPIFNHFNEVFGIRTNRNFEEYLQNLKKYQCGYIELSVQPVGNRDTLLSIPMKDKRFKFFVYYKNDTVRKLKKQSDEINF